MFFNTSGERMVKIPLRINLETIAENGFAGQVSYIKIAFKKWSCIIVEVPESAAKAIPFHPYRHKE